MRSESPAVEPIAAFVDACPDMLCTVDVEGRLLWANRAFLRGMGCSLPAAGEVGEPLAERAEPEQRPAFKAALEARAGGWHGPMRVASGELGRLVWTWAGDAGGRRHASVRVMPDASQPSAAERAWALIRGTDAGVIDYGLAGEILSWNAAAARIFGYSAEEVLGRPGSILRVPGGSTDVDARAAEELLAGRVFREVILNLTKDGRIIACDWEIVLLRDEQGNPIGTAAMVRDVTALEEQRRSLEESNQQLQLVLDNTDLVLWAVDTGGRFTTARGAGLRRLGLTDGELVGKSVYERFPEGAEAVRGAMGGASAVVTLSVGGGDWQVHLIPLLAAGGAITGVLGLSLDVTERLRAERELRGHLELLERQRDTIRALSTPILDVWEGVLALPLIGDIDAARAEQILDALLQEIVSSQSRFAILDLTGVEVVDTTTVHHLVRLLKAISLLGAQGILTGVRPAVAQALVSLGADLPDVPTLGNLRAGLQRCMRDRASPRRRPRG